MAEHAPNLIGRDVLCALDAKITMTPRGLALQCTVKGKNKLKPRQLDQWPTGLQQKR